MISMNGAERRREIREKLEKTKTPLKGQELAKEFGVSRQVIVQDVAILRAEGLELIGTPAGYVVGKENEGFIKTIATRHTSNSAMNKELSIIIENGGKVIDTIIEHDIYGEIRANLHIKSYEELDDFMGSIEGKEPLSKITDGIHLHTIEVENEESFEKILEELEKAGLLNK